MDAILIDKLLSDCIRLGASELHFLPGRPPIVRHRDRLEPLQTEVLEPADTEALLEIMVPERCRQEYRETRSTGFSFAFGEAARFRVQVFPQRGNVAFVLRPSPFLEN